MYYCIVVCNQFVLPCRSGTFFEWIAKFNNVFGIDVRFENHQLNYYSGYDKKTKIGYVKELTHYEN